jgi:plastocyanin
MLPSLRSRAPIRSSSVAMFVLIIVSACGGGGDGGTAPPVVASVQITTPAAPPSFQTLTRTVQFAAVARDASAATISATIQWASSSNAVATVSATGLVTAVGNGTAQITASANGITSPAVTVTVAQVAANVSGALSSIAFGALGSTRQLPVSVVDSSGAAVGGLGAITWARAGAGTTASVSAGGLVTALAVGAADTAVATAGAQTFRIPITVTQFPATVVVSPIALDTLRTTGRTKQYTAVVQDSMGNAIPGAGITWSSTSTGTATIGAGTGLATAVADGSTSIIATSSFASGQRPLVVRRYAETFTLSPSAATITTPLGTQIFLGTATDSVSTALPITWASRTTTVLGLSAASGPQVTATAAGNGTSYVVMQAGTRADSALVTVSGQTLAPLTAGVTVGNSFFRSLNNNTEPAVDTVRVGGTVTWTWAGGLNHNVQSTGVPSFPNSITQGAGNYVFTFNSAGTYLYECIVHGSLMSGRVVVR